MPRLRALADFDGEIFMTVSQLPQRAAVLPPRQKPISDAVPEASPATPKVAVLGRLTWMLFGPFVLLLSAFALLGKAKGFPVFADGAFFSALGAMLLGR